ncbi:MAG TPA: response regulator transcription factor [Desulfobacterales bacterium]|nr:response regulator transcription factor [Desulfobacterales bacterium]
MRLRILLADDHVMFRDGIRPLINREEGMEVVGEAEDGLETVRLAKELKPDIIIMDISMPQLNGVEATWKIREVNPEIKVIILSMHSDRQFVIESLKAGAKAYLLKDSPFEELKRFILAVAKDQIVLSPAITGIVIKDFIHLSKQEGSSVFAILSTRERQVLQLIAEGKATKEIAKDLFLSIKTIESHRRQIMDKLNIHNVAELTKYAIREGLTQLR